MNRRSRDLPIDVQRRIDAHLDAIDGVLAESDMPRADRLAIVGDVEHHIRDTLAQRLGDDESPTAADVEAVLIELDPPDSNADMPASPGRARSPAAGQRSITDGEVAGRLSLGLALGAVALVAIGIVVEAIAPAVGEAIGLLLFVALMLFVVAFACGWSGRRSVYGKVGAGIAVVFVLMAALATP